MTWGSYSIRLGDEVLTGLLGSTPTCLGLMVLAYVPPAEAVAPSIQDLGGRHYRKHKIKLDEHVDDPILLTLIALLLAEADLEDEEDW